jgi:glycosyltransferase involved in cell wall biosynthesis
MKVLLISPRAPQPDGKGDAIRSAVLQAGLQQDHDVEVWVPEPPTVQRMLAAAADLRAGRPAQVGFSMPPACWRDARAAASRADAAIAVTVRAVRGPLPVPLILDHVDALSLNWSLRANGPENRLRRAVARIEAQRLQRWEARVAGWAAAQLVVSEHEVSALPPSPSITVVPMAITFAVPPETRRDIDVVFTGNMRYPPNMDAAHWLDREITPALHRLEPATRVVVAGRDAARLPLRNVETMSDVTSIPAVLARSKVAIVPLTGSGTGVPNKVLEAAACGAALVVTPWVRERLPLPARVAADTGALASETVALLRNVRARSELVRQARAALGPYGVEEIRTRLNATIESATSAARR